jgi:hypothetical protein
LEILTLVVVTIGTIAASTSLALALHSHWLKRHSILPSPRFVDGIARVISAADAVEFEIRCENRGSSLLTITTVGIIAWETTTGEKIYDSSFATEQLDFSIRPNEIRALKSRAPVGAGGADAQLAESALSFGERSILRVKLRYSSGPVFHRDSQTLILNLELLGWKCSNAVPCAVVRATEL